MTAADTTTGDGAPEQEVDLGQRPSGSWDEVLHMSIATPEHHLKGWCEEARSEQVSRAIRVVLPGALRVPSLILRCTTMERSERSAALLSALSWGIRTGLVYRCQPSIEPTLERRVPFWKIETVGVTRTEPWLRLLLPYLHTKRGQAEDMLDEGAPASLLTGQGAAANRGPLECAHRRRDGARGPSRRWHQQPGPGQTLWP